MAGLERNSPIGEQKLCPNPACLFDKHAPRANFCILCGTLLYRRCDNCLDENPMYAKFCHYCGTNLDELRLEHPGTGDSAPKRQAPVFEAPADEDKPAEEAGRQDGEDEDKKG